MRSGCAGPSPLPTGFYRTGILHAQVDTKGLTGEALVAGLKSYSLPPTLDNVSTTDGLTLIPRPKRLSSYPKLKRLTSSNYIMTQADFGLKLPVSVLDKHVVG